MRRAPQPESRLNPMLTVTEEGLCYENRFPLWLRLFLLVWVPLCLPFFALFLNVLQEAEGASVSIISFLLVTMLLCVAPACFSGILLWFALLGDTVQLRLVASSGEAILRRVSLLRDREVRYRLSDVAIHRIELESGSFAHDAASIVLRMPDGTNVRLEGFFRNDDVIFWAKEIETLSVAAAG